MVTPVVTAILRNRDDVLLTRRSDEVGSYRGRWGAVSGHVEPRGGGDRTPEAAVRAEIAEETGLLDACELVRAGDPFEVVDDDLGTTWRVHPFLFECDDRAVDPDEETVETAWVPPTEILRRETVPDLWRSYDRVRPTVESVRTDAEHGSASLSLRALSVLRDRAGELAAGGGDQPAAADRGEPAAGEAGDDRASDPAGQASDPDGDAWPVLAGLARDLLAARPSMAALRTRVDRAMALAVERTPATDATPAAVERSAQETIAAALNADDRAAEVAADRLRGEGVLTLSRSGTVLAALRAAAPRRVVVAESRPAREGVGVAERLADAGLDVTLTTDAAVAHHLARGDVDAVLVGADAVLADGRVVNKVGTRGVALAADREDVPLFVVAARDKITPGEQPRLEDGDPREVYDGDAPLSVAAPRFDVTPADLVTGVITEEGVLDAEDVAEVAADHRALATWREST